MALGLDAAERGGRPACIAAYRRLLLQSPRQQPDRVRAIVGAVEVAADGYREVLDFDVGDSDSENEGFWSILLRSLKSRGFDEVTLLMSDAHTGPDNAPEPCSKAPANSIAGCTPCAVSSLWSQKDCTKWTPR